MMKQKKMATMISKFSPVHTIRTAAIFFFCMLLIFVTSACDPEVEAHTKDVVINIDVQQVSAGYINVEFSTNKNAFYLMGMHPIRKGVDIQSVAKQFMLLALDSAYVDYLYWRNQQLQQLTPFVADFASHSLQYGITNHYFTLLRPATDYWVYAFVVDPNTTKPAGKLFIKTVTTTAESQMPTYFEYRVEGRWEYIYPKDMYGNINSHTPWVGETVDSAYLRQMGYETPGAYFVSRFQDVYDGTYKHILYGIYAHENSVADKDMQPYSRFKEGKTNYAGMAALDVVLTSQLDTNAYDIYRFTWQGDSTDLYFTSEQSLHGAW